MNGQNSNPDHLPKRSTGRQTGSLALGKKNEITQSGSADSKLVRTEAFDQPILLRQPSFWSRAIAMGIVGFVSFVILWASFAKIEQAVPAQGQLEPQNAVQPIQAPINGAVVEEVYVKDGQSVKQGDLLVRFDPTAATAEQRSLEQVRNSLMRQNQFYRSQLSGTASPSAADAKKLNLPPEILSLTENRAALIAENKLYEAQLNGSADAANLTPEQRYRIQAGLLESQTRAAAAQSEVAQAQEELNQVQSQLKSSRETLAINQKIYRDLATLLEEGGIQRLQVVRQQQTVIESQADVDKLLKDEQRLQYKIAGAQQKLANTVALSGKDLLDKIATNNKQIAEIDTTLNKAILDNEKTISETESRLSQAQLTLKYQELRAPVDGVVFDLKAKGRGFVANSTEPVLKIVPNNALVAEVYITNQDIGFVDEGMPVDVRIDSFPFSEFGDIKGKLVTLGSDALPPDQTFQYYRFPARIELDRQTLAVKNGREVPLQSGMAVSANIITRKRSVISIFLEQFTDKTESLKNVR